MRRLFNSVFLLLQLSIFALFVSCQNPLFIGVTELYEVNFSTNGGSSIESYRTNKIKEVPFTSRTGFSFGGWYLNSNFSGSPASFPLEIQKDTTLYAKWLQEFTVSFESNGGDKIDSYKTGVIEQSPETSRTNFIFAGWYTTSDFSGNAVNFPYTVTKPVTLYAKWLPTYNATFVSNGGSDVSTFRTAIISQRPESKREGFSLVGWYTDSNLTKAVEFPFTLKADTTFYAKWQQVYTVNFVTNGGSAVASMQTGYIERAPVTTKNDFGFGGWYLDSECTEGNKVTFPYTVTGSVTLYAKWTAIQCTVTYYPNGASGGSVPQSVTVDKGSSYTVLGNTGNLEKTGYAFTKWNTRADGNGQGYSAGSKITVTGDVALYAQWGKNYGAMITVPGGFFYFGDPNTTNARPKITLSSFQIAQYEVTYELWLEVATWAKENGYNLTAASKGYATNDQFKSFVPATNISWNMACVWLNAYSAYKGYEPVYYRGNSIWKDDTSTSGTFSWNKTKNGYRLPTECEWEFAAGGGNAETHDNYTYAGSNTIGEVAWYNSTELHPVGTKKQNLLGLFDMSGSVAEWCYDYNIDFGTGELTNPIHETGSYKVIRGGSCIANESNTLANTRSCEIYERCSNYEYEKSQYYEKWNGMYRYFAYGKALGIRPARNAE